MHLAVSHPYHNVRFVYRLGSQRPAPFRSGGLLGSLTHTSSLGSLGGCPGMMWS
jgi:hypothetical protein